MKNRPHPIENESVSDGFLHRLREGIKSLPSSTRFLILLTLLGGASALTEGCAHFDPQNPKRTQALAAYDRGDYLGARSGYFNEEKCVELLKKSQDTGQDLHPEEMNDAVRCEDIEKGVAGIIAYFIKEARAAVNFKSKQFNNYSKAIGYYQRALQLMEDDHPQRKEAEKEIEKIRAKLGVYEQEYQDHYDKLVMLLAEEGEYEEEVWQNIRWTFERLRVLRINLEKKDTTLSPLAIEFARKFYEKEDYERAQTAAELAKAVNEEDHFPSETEQFVAIVYYLGEAQKQAEQEKLKDLVQELKIALKEKNHTEMNRLIAEIRAIDPRHPSIRKPKKKRRYFRKKSEPKRVAASAPAGEPAEAANGNGNGGQLSSAEMQLEVDDFLREVSEMYENGGEFEAIVQLESAIKEAQGNPYLNRLLRQRRLWEPVRKRLIHEYLKEADQFYINEDRRGIEFYQRVIDLNPPADKRRHAREHRKKLQDLLGE